MESFVNQPFIDKQAKYAKWGSYVGFGALFLGLLTTSRQPILAYVFLLVGLLGATFGSYMASRYVREPRPDQTLAEVMETSTNALAPIITTCPATTSSYRTTDSPS